MATIAQITLDIYNNNYILINAKQADVESRFVEVTVTEKGKPLILDKNLTSVHVRCGKPDGKYVYSQNCTITDTGKVLVELTQQMLAVNGKCHVDLSILQYSVSDESTETSLRYNVSVLSTMGFYINVVEQPIDTSVIVSENDFDVLTQGIMDMLAVQKEVEKSIETVADISAEEEKRQEAEVLRQEAEILREETFASTISACETVTENAIESTNNAVTATNSANTAASNADSATERANNAAETCESVIDGSGIILQDEKGKANGIATLDANSLVPNTQINTQFVSEEQSVIISGEALNIMLGKIAAYMNAFDNLPKVRTGTTNPDPSLGNDGDYYLKLLVEE